jgi:hypothetical protein
MARSHGWSVLAEKALELAALALSVRVMERSEASPRSVVPSLPAENVEPLLCHAEPVEARPSSEPLAFIKETPIAGTRYYRASDDRGEVFAAFYSDGRVRIASTQRRYAGVVDGGQADLLDVENSGWSRLFVRTTPEGRVQIELRGGADDARILTCDEIA